MFRPASPTRGESGYVRANFKVEYQLIACFGELHLAYSVVPKSVWVDRTPGYVLRGRTHPVAASSPTVTSVKLRGIVAYGTQAQWPFGDNFAGQALGFGCFTGQTQKIASIKDILGAEAASDRVKALMENQLTVTFVTDETLGNADAERAILASLPPPPEVIQQRRKSADDYIRSLQAQ